MSAKALGMAVAMAGLAGVAPSARADGFQLSGPDSAELVVLEAGDVALKFTESGTLTVTGSGTAHVLVVGGGGGGGAYAGGGGGGGEVVEAASVELTEGEYEIVVGAGGLGATTNDVASLVSPAENGGDSSAFGLVAKGGGAGGGSYVLKDDGTGTTWINAGFSGGSGGGNNGERTDATGAKGSVTLADGTTNDGGKGSGNLNSYYTGGGGGGAGGAGLAYAAATDTSAELYPTGGVGVASSILDVETWYGGGGAGGTSYGYQNAASGGKGGGGAGGGGDYGHNQATSGGDAVANSGGGGGGAGRCWTHRNLTMIRSGYRGGNGADGVVIVRWSSGCVWKDETPKQTGGTVKKAGDYFVHTFTEDGTFETAEPVVVDALVVAGGGAGGWRGETGGGGAGGVLIRRSLHLPPGSYPVTVGEGGIASEDDASADRDGSPSSFAGLHALGGGAGSNHYSAGHVGGSGGGAGGHGNWVAGYYYLGGKGTEGQGHDGGSNKENSNAVPTGPARGGGGGGAGGPGSVGLIVNDDGTYSWCGDGGDGVMCDFSGEEKWYGGGGGAGVKGWGTQLYGAGQGGKGGGGGGSGKNGGTERGFPGESGEDGTGGGGGGGGLSNSETLEDSNHGGNGGSGIVIIRYKRLKYGFMTIVK